MPTLKQPSPEDGRDEARTQVPKASDLRKALHVTWKSLISRKTRAKAIHEAIQRYPDWSDRFIAKALRCSPTTVGTMRKTLSNLDTAKIGLDGVKRKPRIYRRFAGLKKIQNAPCPICKTKPEKVRRLRGRWTEVSNHLTLLNWLTSDLEAIPPTDPLYKPTKIRTVIEYWSARVNKSLNPPRPAIAQGATAVATPIALLASVVEWFQPSFFHRLPGAHKTATRIISRKT